MNNKQALKFSVIIPVYNNWDQLKNCLDAISRQSLEPALFEIIVVDNGSETPVPDRLPLTGKIRLVGEEQPGSYAARNTGAEIANGEILAFTDSDCLPNRDWLANALKLFNDKECDMIGGEIEIFRSEGGSGYVYIYEKYFAFRQKEWVPKGISCTANLFIVKNKFSQTEGFDEDLKSGGDWEFSQRCVEMGYKMIYDESVLVYHPARKNLRAMLKKHFRHICWSSITRREKYQCSQVKLLASSFLYSFKNLFSQKAENATFYERVIIFNIDFIKMLVQLIGNTLILLKLVNPEEVRE